VPVNDPGPSFEVDIRPLFRTHDIRAMAGFFDLASYDDVREHAEEVWQRVEGGSMPCDQMWPDDQVELFRRWIDSGSKP
jgi:hypothetical protein